MHDITSTPSRHRPLGIRIAVAVVGALLLGLLFLLGQVALKQSATQQTLEDRRFQQEGSGPASGE